MPMSMECPSHLERQGGTFGRLCVAYRQMETSEGHILVRVLNILDQSRQHLSGMTITVIQAIQASRGRMSGTQQIACGTAIVTRTANAAYEKAGHISHGGFRQLRVTRWR